MLREISFLPQVNMRHLIQLTWPLSLRQPCTEALQPHMTFYYGTVVASTIYFLSFCHFLADLNLYFLVLIPGLCECFKYNHQSFRPRGNGREMALLSDSRPSCLFRLWGTARRGLWLTCSWRWLLFCVVFPVHTRKVSSFCSPRAENYPLKHQIPVCASET